MEHLGGEIASHFHKVPYTVQHQYDHGSFAQFPERAGWYLADNKQWERLPSDRTVVDDSIDGFIQAWLYFGLLAEVLGLNPTDLAQFYTKDVHGSWWITTACLPQYLHAWTSNLARPDHVTLFRLIRAQMALDKAYHLVSTCCSVSGADEEPIWRLDSGITLSLLVLGETLAHAISAILEQRQHQVAGWFTSTRLSWGYSTAVIQRMRRDMWCPHSLNLLLGILQKSCSGLLYAMRIGHFKDLDLDHDACDLRECKARQRLSSKTHWHSDGACSCSHIGPETGELSRLIQEGRLVVLKYDFHSSRIECIPYRDDIQFTIFSHVWTDGFGNPQSNTMPMCQLQGFLEVFDRLARAEDSLRSASNQSRPQAPVYFWIDTLAIPCGIEHQNERRAAIRTMHQLYSLSANTVVLDAGLMNVTRGHDYAETAMKITMSYWITRLWTLQEAYLSRKLLFNFRDALQDMDDLERSRGSDLVSPIISAARTYFELILGHERKRAHTFTHRASIVEHERNDIDSRLLSSVWNALQQRTTTHAEHETLAIATLLRLDTSPFDDVSISSKHNSLHHRNHTNQKMQQLLSTLAQTSQHTIPTQLLFVPGTKLSSKGFRWAPASWIYDSKSMMRKPYPSSQTRGRLTPEGLLFESSGYFLRAAEPETFRIGALDQFSFPTDITLRSWVTVTTLEQSLDTRTGTDLKRLALITQTPHPHILPHVALLVVVENVQSGIVYATIISHVWFSPEHESERIRTLKKHWLSDLSEGAIGEVLAPSTEWCVDGSPPNIPTDSGMAWSLLSSSTWFSWWQIRSPVAEISK